MMRSVATLMDSIHIKEGEGSDVYDPSPQLRSSQPTQSTN